MAQFTTPGYDDIRAYVRANWTYIELRDTAGTAIVRLPLSDARVDFVESAAGTNPLMLRVVITGSDADIPVPVTVRSSAIYKVASGGSALSVETLVEGDGIISADADTITVTHNLEVPEIP